MDRRSFCLSAAAVVAATQASSLSALAPPAPGNGPLITLEEIERIDRERILRAASAYLPEPPVTITSSSSPRSKGGKHDYSSEADYFWPDPRNPNGPYIQRDGYSNPQDFNDHRKALIRLSLMAPALTAAWLITQEKRYAVRAAAHLRAWFLDAETRMNPSLDYAQAVWGLTPGRSYGIIDTLHLVEVTRAARHLESAQAMTTAEFAGVREWFAEYLLWLRASNNGQQEEVSKNNHGTCWAVQVAGFAAYTGNENAMVLCRERFREHLLPEQMAADGSFPLELKRTRPYNYSLFDLDMLAMVCVIASAGGPGPGGETNNLWQFALPNGNRYKKAVDFLSPYIEDKSKWPYAHDVESFDDLPNRQPSLLFAGLAYREPKYIELWRRLPPDPKSPEIIRNFPIRQPVLWVRPV
jgi:hypothetical protein